MAGYMKKLNGYNYLGEMKSDSELQNGMIVKISSGKLVAATKSTDYVVAKIEDEEVHGVAGARYRVLSIVTPVYFVENHIIVNDSEAYDTSTATIPAGDFVRVHPLTAGEELCSTITGLV